MLKISRRYAHIVYGVLQSGLTCGAATAVSTFTSAGSEHLFVHWLQSWFLSWVFMLPVVVLAAPWIRALANALANSD